MIDIYRFELIFLNPEENRWQLFQETSNTIQDEVDGSAVYRREAQWILQWIRESIERLCIAYNKDREPTFAVPPKSEAKGVTLDLSYIYKRLNRTAREMTRAYSQGIYDKFLKDAQERMQRIIGLEKIESQASEPCKNLFVALRPNARKTLTLSHDEALALISALHVARNWDLFGRLSFPELCSPAKASSEATIKPSPAFVQQFSYCLNWKKRTLKTSSRAEKALGYRVQLGFLSTEKREPEKTCTNKVNPGKQTRADKINTARKGSDRRKGFMKPYYEYCHDVKTDEALWYCLYGLLLDALTSGLSGKEAKSPPSEPVYITCIPVRICGYDHFLQLYWRPERPDEPLDNLRDAAKAFTKLFGQTFGDTGVRIMGPLKECLRELFVQMHIAAFQHHVLSELNAIKYNIDWNSDESIDILFCNHAPNLVRVDEILLHDNKGRFRYKTSSKRIFEAWHCDTRHIEKSPLINPGAEVKEHIARIKAIMSREIRALVPWEEVFEGPLNPLFNGTGKDRLQEQYGWLRRTLGIWMTMLEAERNVTSDFQKIRAAILNVHT